jgi:hypothetical protein
VLGAPAVESRVRRPAAGAAKLLVGRAAPRAAGAQRFAAVGSADAGQPLAGPAAAALLAAVAQPAPAAPAAAQPLFGVPALAPGIASAASDQ